MEKLTCCVVLGFLCLHLAEIFLILSTATPEWLKGDHNETTDTNITHPHITKGLWKICVDDNCTRINETLQDEWFRSVQGLDVVAVGTGLMALMLSYSIILADRCSRSGPAALFNTAMQVLSAISALTAISIFGAKARKPGTNAEFPDEYEVQFGWSFWVDIVGVVSLWLSALLSIHRAVHYTVHRQGYENIIGEGK